MIRIDPLSLLVTCTTGIPRKEIEARLLSQGLTLGHGSLQELCVAVKFSYKGKTVQTKNVPRSATGPDFKKIVMSDKAFRLLEITLRASPLPEERSSFKIRWKNKSGADHFLKLFWGSGIRPLRLNKKSGRIEITLQGLSDIVAAEAAELKSFIQKTKGTLHA